jgi:hypothetical protein
MTGLIFEVYLFLMALLLLALGGLLTWPIARRVGERQPHPYLWTPVETPTGRRWQPAPEPVHLGLRDRLTLWIAELRDMAHDPRSAA